MQSAPLQSHGSETIIKNFIIERVELGVGLTLNQVQDVMQEILLEKRHNLTYRSTMSIHKGRAIVDPRTVHSWFELTKERLLNDPELSECWKDPHRIFNQDETPCVLALSMRRSLPLWATTDPSTTSAETPGHTPASAPSSLRTGSTSADSMCQYPFKLLEENLRFIFNYFR